MESSGIQNYLNTLIFCVVAKTISIFVLAFLINEKVRYFSYFLLTIEVGLVVIIIAAIITISNYDKKMSKQAADFRKSQVSNINCPEYYIKTSMNNEVYCEDSYTSPDGRISYNFSSNASYLKNIPLEEQFLRKDFETACANINQNGLSNISWTSLRSKCVL